MNKFGHTSLIPSPNCKGQAGDKAIADCAKKAGYEGACFAGGTLVFADCGPAEIQNLGPGNLVLARCEETGEIAFRKVLKQHTHEDRKVVRLYYLMSTGTGDCVHTTAEQPFWVQGRGWTAARHIRSGDVIETCNGRGYIDAARWPGIEKIENIHPGATVTVSAVVESDDYLFVYNIEVEDFQTFCVGAEGLWVRDASCTGTA